jgi:hypothetical protein
VLGKRLDACEIVDRQKIVYKRQRSLHAARQRTIIGRAKQRVEPNEPVAAAMKARHLAAEHVRFAAIPPIGDQQHDGSVSHHATAPSCVERPQRVADSGAAAPVGNARRNPAHGSTRVRPPQVAGYASQTRGKQKGLDSPRARRQPVHEMEQHPRVTLHGSAHVTNQHQRTTLRLARTRRQLDQLAASA